jgi:hypothetical protein
MANRVDRNHHGLLWSDLLMPQFFPVTFDRCRLAPVRVSAWWWYWDRTEEASAMA